MASSHRVVTYNVLSSKLSRASYFKHCVPESVTTPENRWNLLVSFLNEEMSRSSIICLQEVSQEWRSKLSTFFRHRKYAFEGQQYGSKFTGTMGVGIAYPVEQYIQQDMKLIGVADKKKGGYFGRKDKVADPFFKETSKAFGEMLSAYGRVVKSYGRLFSALWVDAIGASEKPKHNDEEPFDPARVWPEVRRRWNVLVAMRLSPINNETSTFVVGTYHMPCAFWAPAVMTAHASIAANALFEFAGESDAVIFGGDFNFKPTDAMYALYVTGDLSADHEHHPPQCFEGDDWKVGLKRKFKSAYLEVDGREPEITNRARTADAEEAFEGTLDYLFYASGTESKLRAHTVLDIKRRIRAARKLESLPSETEGSDHLPLAAEFDLTVIG